jgi:hypothetical protein
VRRSGQAQQRRSNGEDNEKPSRWLGELHGVPLRLGNLEAEVEVARAGLSTMRWRPWLVMRRRATARTTGKGANASGGLAWPREAPRRRKRGAKRLTGEVPAPAPSARLRQQWW